jgi:hypothetical protein
MNVESMFKPKLHVDSTLFQHFEHLHAFMRVKLASPARRSVVNADLGSQGGTQCISEPLFAKMLITLKYRSVDAMDTSSYQYQNKLHHKRSKFMPANP